MKKLKKEIRWFSIMEYEKEENYLSKRHLEGWKFKSVTFPGLYARDIADPWYTGNFDVTYDDVKEGCEAFLQYLIENESLY